MTIYSEIQKHANHSSSETKQFRALMKVISRFGYTNELHGNKHRVVFDNPLSKRIPKPQVCCELCDVLVFIYNGSEARYTFLQNKRNDRKKYVPVNKTKIPLSQRYLLGAFPTVEMNDKKLYIPSDIFTNRTLDSIGTVGVFYKDNLGKLNMDLSIMNLMKYPRSRLIKSSHYTKGSKRVHHFSGTRGAVRTVNGFVEIQSCNNLIDFEKALVSLKIGEPISFSRKSISMFVINLVREVLLKEPSINVDKYLRDLYKIETINELGTAEINTVTVSKSDTGKVKKTHIERKSYPNFKVAIIDVNDLKTG